MNMQEKEQQLFFHTYKRLSLEIDRGEGCYLFAKDGKEYLDMFAGLAVNALGYNHPALINAIEKQIRKYNHLSNYFIQETQVQLAEQLLKISGYEKLFFTNSGTEAIEGALKLVRKWGSTKGKINAFGMTNGFSGRTMGALSLMDKDKYRAGYGPFLDHCGHIEFNNVESLKKSVDEKTAAVFLEFVQGEGGIVPVTREFVETLKHLSEKFGFLVVADEIQAGIYRSGKFFSFQYFDISPDLVTVAKPIGGGLPLGAILGSNKVADVWTYGVHGTTFGGNPVACAAGIALLNAVTTPEMQAHINAMSKYLFSKLNDLQRRFSVIKEVRGMGLMIGIELNCESAPVVDAMLAKGVLANATASTVVRILPPLILAEKDANKFLNAFEEVLEAL